MVMGIVRFALRLPENGILWRVFLSRYVARELRAWKPDGKRGSGATPMTSGTHGAGHREASGRPGAGEADEQRGQDERRRQHAIFVS